MDFLEQMIRTKNHKHKHHDYDSHRFDHGGSSRQGHAGADTLILLAKSIIKNKTLLIFLIIAILVLAMLCIFAVIMILPWVLSLFGYVEQGGINGIVDIALRIIRSIWEGSGK